MTQLSRPVLALIPARGGSKGVPRKNMRMISGKPLVEYTLQAAFDSNCITAIYVSSDDDEILMHGQAFGAIAVRRPAEYATDAASASDVLKHFLDVLPTELIQQDPYLLYLQPTSPLRTGLHIDAALKMIADRGVHTLLSVVELAKSPFKAFTLDPGGNLQSLFDERLSNASRQELPKTYMPNGAIYVFRVSDFRHRGGFPSNGSIPYLMSDAASLDIDTEQDILQLERILKERNG